METDWRINIGWMPSGSVQSRVSFANKSPVKKLSQGRMNTWTPKETTQQPEEAFLKSRAKNTAVLIQVVQIVLWVHTRTWVVNGSIVLVWYEFVGSDNRSMWSQPIAIWNQEQAGIFHTSFISQWCAALLLSALSSKVASCIGTTGSPEVVWYLSPWSGSTSVAFRSFDIKVCKLRIHLVSTVISCWTFSSLFECWGTLCFR